MTTFNKIIGSNIRTLREKQGLSQEVLADYLKVSRPIISYYETGERNIPTTHLSKIADLFGLYEYDLLEANAEQQLANVALAFRTGQLTNEDLENIASFRRIVKNYLGMKQKLENE